MAWAVEQGKLHFTIGSTPQGGVNKGQPELILANDVQMVKAGLLYADHTTLVSLACSALFELSTVKEIEPDSRLDFLKEMMSWLPEDDTAIFRTLLSMVEQANDPALNKILNDSLSEGWVDIRTRIDGFVDQVGGAGLFRAVEAGLLEVHKFEKSLRRVTKESEHRKLALEYLEIVSSTVSEAKTYPLFDQDTNEVITAGIRAGIFSAPQSSVARGKEAALASDVLSRLPLFPSATVKEILDIRRELEKQLTRFRAAIIKFSDRIKNAGWDDNFPFDAEQVFRSEVEPAVLNLDEAVRANSFVSRFARNLADKSLLVTSGSALALTMSNLPIPKIASLAVGGLVGGATAAYDAYEKWHQKSIEIEQNNLYFFFKAKELLEDGSFQYISDRK